MLSLIMVLLVNFFVKLPFWYLVLGISAASLEMLVQVLTVKVMFDQWRRNR